MLRLVFQRRILINRKKFFVYDDYTEKLARLAANATTNEELAKLCQRMYIADYINLENMDIWLAKHALTAVYRVLKQYPALRRRINYFGTLRGFEARKDDLFAFLYPDSDSYARDVIKKMTDKTVKHTRESFEDCGWALAFTSNYNGCHFSGIMLDENDFDEKAIMEDMEYCERSGFHPIGCSNIKSVVEHELGHILDYWLGISDSLEFQKKIKTVDEEYIGKNLSRYCVDEGTVNYHEVVAEGFAEMRNNPKPRGVARFVGHMIDKEYQRMLKFI